MAWTKQPDGSWTWGPVTVRGDAVHPRWLTFLDDQQVCRPGGYHTAQAAMLAAERIKVVREALGIGNRVPAMVTATTYAVPAIPDTATGHLTPADSPGSARTARQIDKLIHTAEWLAEQLRALKGEVE